MDSAISINPNNENYYDGKGELLILQKKYTNAIIAYNKIINCYAGILIKGVNGVEVAKTYLDADCN